jgi:hypothetical protein
MACLFSLVFSFENNGENKSLDFENKVKTNPSKSENKLKTNWNLPIMKTTKTGVYNTLFCFLVFSVFSVFFYGKSSIKTPRFLDRRNARRGL